MADGNVRPIKAATQQSLTEALIAAQSAFEDIGKVKQGARGKYAPLDEVLAAVRPVLNKHGVALLQKTEIQDDWLVVRTVLKHGCGETDESVYPVCVLGKTPQETGSALTYARRYALLAICGVHPSDEDDDGERGAGAAGRPAARAPAPSEPDADMVAAEQFVDSQIKKMESLGGVDAVLDHFAALRRSKPFRWIESNATPLLRRLTEGRDRVVGSFQKGSQTLSEALNDEVPF